MYAHRTLRESTDQVTDILEVPAMATAEPNSRADEEEEEEEERGTMPRAALENASSDDSTPDPTAVPTPCDSSASGTLPDWLPTPDPTPEPSQHSAHSLLSQTQWLAALLCTVEIDPTSMFEISCQKAQDALE